MKLLWPPKNTEEFIFYETTHFITKIENSQLKKERKLKQKLR